MTIWYNLAPMCCMLLKNNTATRSYNGYFVRLAHFPWGMKYTINTRRLANPKSWLKAALFINFWNLYEYLFRY